MPLLTVSRAECWKLAPLFAERDELRAVVDCVLEGHLGQAVVDDPQTPRVARLDIGCYAVLGGDPFAPAARQLIGEVRAPLELAFPDSGPWRRLLHKMHDPNLSDRSMRSFATDHCDPGELFRAAERVPDGFTVVRLDVDEAARLDRDLEPHGLQTFSDAADLVARGIGFCARADDGRIACVSSSYAVCTGRIELAVATHPEFRRLGLARAVAARLTLHCLERGIVPHWNAANPVSQHLAVTLGYRPAGTCEILFLE